MSGRSPDHVEAKQLAVDQRDRRCCMPDRRDAADRVAGARLDELGVGAPDGTDQGRDFLLVDALVARGHDQHRRVVTAPAEDHALGDLADADSQCIGRLLRSARGDVEVLRRMRVMQRGQQLGHAAKAFGTIVQRLAHAARFANKALPDRDTGLRPSRFEMNAAASTSLSMSMPVSMPRPLNMNSTSSVATLPVAPFAYGQPPKPAMLASKV